MKAAYIYNFAKFTEWPPGVVKAAEPLLMCVVGDLAVGDELERVVKGRLLAGHGIAVTKVTASGPQGTCHVWYVSGVTARQAAQLVDTMRDLPVLTISDIEGFMGAGGIAEFFYEHGRLRFSVQQESVKRARLQISSRLLVLAKTK